MPRSQKATVPVVATTLDPNRRWLTVTESATYLHISPQTIRALIHEGRLKAIPDGVGISHGYRLDRHDLDMFFTRAKKVIAPYRRGTRPWVAERHARNRKRAAR